MGDGDGRPSAAQLQLYQFADEECKATDEDVGFDASVTMVEDWAQLDERLEHAECPLDLLQLAVRRNDIVSGQ